MAIEYCDVCGDPYCAYDREICQKCLAAEEDQAKLESENVKALLLAAVKAPDVDTAQRIVARCLEQHFSMSPEAIEDTPAPRGLVQSFWPKIDQSL